MTEIVDNAVQLVAALCCTVGSVIQAVRTRRQEWCILACFYGTFAMGLIYWLVFELLLSYTPRYFYVADLSWIASYLFMLTLEIAITVPEAEKFRTAAAWLSPVVGISLTLYYIQFGDVLSNALTCGFTTAAGWYAIRGIRYYHRYGKTPEDRSRLRLHHVILVLIFLEYCLWTASCFWISDTMTNPYFWFDYMLSAALPALYAAARRALPGETRHTAAAGEPADDTDLISEKAGEENVH